MKNNKENNNQSLSKREIKKILNIIQVRSATEKDIKRFTEFIESNQSRFTKEEMKNMYKVLAKDTAFQIADGSLRIATMFLICFLFGIERGTLKSVLAGLGIGMIAGNTTIHIMNKNMQSDVRWARSDTSELAIEYSRYNASRKDEDLYNDSSEDKEDLSIQ